MTLLYIDDVCAILITAIFYVGYLSAISFMIVRPAALGLLASNLAGVI